MTADPATAAQQQRKLAEAWADNAIAQVRACASWEALCDWIAGNGERLGHCEQHARDAWQRLKLAIDAKAKEFRT